MPVVVDFLNVGHGDCTVIRHASGRLTVVDVNNAEDLDPTTEKELEQEFAFDSRQQLLRMVYGANERALLKEAGYAVDLTNPIEFLKRTYPDKRVFRYIQTHPDMDHMRGLDSLCRNIGLDNFWDTNNDKPIADFRSDGDKIDWSAYQSIRTGQVQGITVRRYMSGTRTAFFNEEPAGTPGGDGIHILAPTPDLSAKANETSCWNLHSYVIAVTHAGTTFVLGGDADVDTWDSIVSRYGANIRCVALKASHHGRESGYHQKAMELMKPEYVIVSVGKKPDTDAYNHYRKHCDKVWSTRWLGNIRLTIHDNGRVTPAFQYSDRV